MGCGPTKWAKQLKSIPYLRYLIKAKSYFLVTSGHINFRHALNILFSLQH